MTNNFYINKIINLIDRGVLDECLKELLDKKDADFEKLTGKEKISCPKKLRDKMEKRFGQLFSSVFKVIGEK